jgi:TIR domain
MTDPSAITTSPVDFFISYTSSDVQWARWISAQLEEAGYTVVVQDWDWGPGSNFVAEMHAGLKRSAKLIVVASEAFFASRWTEEEWTSAFYVGRGAVIPVCVEPITLPGLLGPVVRINLSGLTEDEASERLLSGLAPRKGRDAPAPFLSADRPLHL